jgi:hypothetical protein
MEAGLGLEDDLVRGRSCPVMPAPTLGWKSGVAAAANPSRDAKPKVRERDATTSVSPELTESEDRVESGVGIHHE